MGCCILTLLVRAAYTRSSRIVLLQVIVSSRLLDKRMSGQVRQPVARCWNIWKGPELAIRVPPMSRNLLERLHDNWIVFESDDEPARLVTRKAKTGPS